MSQSRREKSCPPLFSLMPCCQLAVRSRQELGAMLINISAPDTFNQQPQLGQCICKKVNEYLFWFPSNLVFGGDHCLCRWQSTKLLLKWNKLVQPTQRGQRRGLHLHTAQATKTFLTIKQSIILFLCRQTVPMAQFLPKFKQGSFFHIFLLLWLSYSV